ncbi:MAG: rane protein of unknown function [Nitrospirae bacterium]|nr:rane protein of unknown function [Nitrospirota bacterium]
MTIRLLTVILMFSVLLFGSVELWSATAVQLSIFTIGLIWMLRGEYRKYDIPGTVRLLFITLAIFIIYGILQAVPLPTAVVKVISPHSFEIQSFYSVSSGNTMTLSLNRYRTIYETIKGAAFLIVFALSATSLNERDTLRDTLRTFTVFGFSLAVFALVQKATSSNSLYWFRELTLGGAPFGPFVNRNHFAGLIGMLIPLGLGLAITQREKEKKLLFGFMTVIMAVSLFFSLSRGGTISFFTGVALFMVLMFQYDKGSRKLWMIGFFVTVVLCYVIYLGIDPLIERFYKTDISSEERIVVWSATWTAVRDFWLTGSGLGSFINIFPLYSPPSVQGGVYDYAHNDYLEFFLETGLVGTIFLVVFLALLLFTVLKNPLRSRIGVLRAAALTSAFTMMVHSIFDFNLHILSNMLMFACILGMIAGMSIMKDNPEKSNDMKEKEKLKERLELLLKEHGTELTERDGSISENKFEDWKNEIK